jgi:hypothetical protein
MDALKFAFEILIVGALALPWVALLIRMFSPYTSPGEPEKPIDVLEFLLPSVASKAGGAVAMALIIGTGYLLGSVVSRVSRNLFNDELLWFVPQEDTIRVGVYRDEYCSEELLDDLDLPEFRIRDHPRMAEGLCPQTVLNSADNLVSFLRRYVRLFPLRALRNGSDEKFDARVQEMFRLQEGLLLLNGLDKVERLKEYYDQITVLRGGALNLIILFAVCLFGYCGNYRARWSQRPSLMVLAFVPACLVLIYALFSFWRHYHYERLSPYRDPPLAETVLFLLGAIGVFVILKAKHARYYGPTCVVAAILTVISFGGWWWTEVMYDLQVIHSAPELQLKPRDSTPQSNAGPQP